MNFWIGHTNFGLTERMANVIESVDGVESLDIQTRYRFRVSIGKLFDSARVKKNIELYTCLVVKLADYGLDYKASINILRLKSKLAKEHKFWCLMVTPNGGVQSYGNDDVDAFNQELVTYKETTKGVGGLLFCSKQYDSKRAPSKE